MACMDVPVERAITRSGTGCPGTCNKDKQVVGVAGDAGKYDVGWVVAGTGSGKETGKR